MVRRPITRRRALLAVLAACGAATGCGYSVRPPFEPNIRTVYVPIFQSDVFQRDLNLKLTEAVIKEIERRSGYKVVGNPEEADTTLSGRILLADKNLILENPNNLSRQLAANLNVTVRWVDNRNGNDSGVVNVGEYAYFFPELGETAQGDGYQKVINTLARDIVGMMESPW